MTTRKNQNSILVLATLGVYLGLVLVGATPQILAQAAMTKQFNVKDEIEVKDDLDKKPDDERALVSTSLKIYLEDVEYFLSSLGRLRDNGKFDLKKDTFDVAQNTLLPCVDSNIAGRYTPIRFDSSNDSSRSTLDRFIGGMAYGYSFGDCLENHEFNRISAADSQFNFKLDDTKFAITIAVRKHTLERAKYLNDELEFALHDFSIQKNAKLRSQIIACTQFGATNDQVFIITRLPRAGLDSLLASSAK